MTISSSATDALHDLRFALRQLWRSPGFAAVAIFTLALGIGANTAIFSVVRGVVLAPLPFAEPDRLTVVIQRNLTQNYDASVSYLDFLDWQRTSTSFQQMVAYSREDFDLTNPGEPEHLSGGGITAGFFQMLGVHLALGREFSAADEVHGGAPVAIISDQMWADRFARSPAVLGQTLTLDGVSYTIIGVLPRGFSAFKYGAVYVPEAQADPLIVNDRTVHVLLCFARLKPGVTIEQAHAEMNGVQENLNRLYPALDHGLETTVMPMKELFTQDVSGTLLLLMGAVGVVLLIACANVANLLLARSASRSREFALRVALGAGRGRMIRQLFAESLLLSLAGGAAGLLATKWALGALLAAFGKDLPRQANISVSASVLLFAFAVSMAIGLLFGLAPALRASSVDPQIALKEGGRGATRAHHSVQNGLAISQMALTLVLLAGAGLLFRTIRHLLDVNPGLDPQNVVTFQFGISAVAAQTPAGIRNAFGQTLDRIRTIPGVEAADFTSVMPLAQQDNTGPFWLGTQPPRSMAEATRAIYYEVGPDYLRVMGIPLLRGRFFTQQDTTETEPVVVIDNALAQEFFPGADPIGQRITIAHWATARIVGVVGHVKQWGLGKTGRLSQSQIYISFFQLTDQWIPLFRGSMAVVVRTTHDTKALMPAIRGAVYGASNDQPMYNVETMEDVVADSMSSQRFPMILLGAFAALALVLASVGIYGVISYSVAQRVHEIGIRVALGADRATVFRMVVGHGLRLALAGVAVGGVAAFVLTRLLSAFSGLLFGVSAADPVTFISIAAALTAVALVASYIPARRATKVDPMVALRCE